MGAEHSGLLPHSNVRWLSRRKLLERVDELHDEIGTFFTEYILEVADRFNDKWIAKLLFLVRGESKGGDRPPETYESNFIRHNFVQFGKLHSLHMAILSSIVLSQQCCEAYFISLTVATLLWVLATKYY